MNMKQELLIKQAKEGYTSSQTICPSAWSLLPAMVSSPLPTAPTTSSIATALASFRLPCNRLSATCFAKTDGQKK